MRPPAARRPGGEDGPGPDDQRRDGPSDNLRWARYSGARSPQSVLPEVPRWIADRAWLSTTIAAITLTSELLFPLALVVRRLRLVLVGSVVGLHVGVHLLLGLDYWSWVAVVVILFVPSALAGRPRSGAPGADPSVQGTVSMRDIPSARWTAVHTRGRP